MKSRRAEILNVTKEKKKKEKKKEKKKTKKKTKKKGEKCEKNGKTK